MLPVLEPKPLTPGVWRELLLPALPLLVAAAEATNDDVALRLVPGSQYRHRTGQETEAIMNNLDVELPGQVVLELKAGQTFFYFDEDGDSYLSPQEFQAARNSARTP